MGRANKLKQFAEESRLRAARKRVEAQWAFQRGDDEIGQIAQGWAETFDRQAERYESELANLLGSLQT